jgi:uncharacterized protein (DUF362 family)
MVSECSAVHPIDSFLDTLAAQAQPEGGWGYVSGQAAHLEPTCLALLALSLAEDRYEAVRAQALSVLQACATADGTYRLARGRPEAAWPTALVLFVQAVLGHSVDETRRTAAGLLALRGRIPPKDQELEVHDIDLELTGWPWAEGNFSWVEPTAWACLALRRAGYGDHPRVQEGLRLLLDRALDEGGINYGNRRILGRLTAPIPGPTALMLLALQRGADHPRTAAAVAYLLRQALASEDLEHLCWAKLALDVYHERPDVAGNLATLDDRILQAHQARTATPWLRPAPLREALTVLALSTERNNPFRLQIADCRLQIDPPQSAFCNLQSAIPLRRRPWKERVVGGLRGLVVDAVGRLRPAPAHAAVDIAPVADYNADLAGTLQRQFEAFRGRVPLAGKRVILKPNLVEFHRDKVINTHPHVVAAAIELCRREGAAEILVAEGPGHWRNVEYLVTASGLGDVLRHYQVPFIDLNQEEPVKCVNLGRLTGLDYLYLAQTIVSADLVISLAKLKTHHWAGATLSLKNLFGTLPGTCYGWPKNELHWRGIDNSIVDIALTRPPDLAIVDGVVAMEGDGPLNGTAKPLGALVMGCDPVAVDATCCRLMRLNPQRMGYLVLGARKRLGVLGEEAIVQIGERIDALAQPFETVPHLHQLYLNRSA